MITTPSAATSNTLVSIVVTKSVEISDYDRVRLDQIQLAEGDINA